MSTPLLFDDLPAVTGAPDEGKTKARGRSRVLLPNRSQLELRPSDLESLLAEGHRARLVWGFVERQDLSALYAKIKASTAASGGRRLRRRFSSRCGFTPRRKAWGIGTGTPEIRPLAA